MNPCKHLDYNGEYINCEIVEITGFSCRVRHWRRGTIWTDGPLNEGNPKNVQFCKLRGRIKGIFQCYNPGEMSCYDVSLAQEPK